LPSTGAAFAIVSFVYYGETESDSEVLQYDSPGKYTQLTHLFCVNLVCTPIG
jgi:hypothetical protein